MTGTTYYSAAANEQLHAQRILDVHVTSSANGRCIECGVLGPCSQRETALGIFTGTLRLPRRRPGATQPELVGARRLDDRGWG